MRKKVWNNIAVSTSDEETVNNAFCSNGVFKILGDEKVTEYPRIQANVENKKMVISIDQSIILLEDVNVVKCSFLAFDSRIESFVISQSGKFIVCALADGDVYGVSIKGIVIFNLCVKTEDVSTSNTFIGIQRNEKDFYITCCNGAVYRLINVDESVLDNISNESFHENETYPSEEAIMQNVILERIIEGKSCRKLSANALVLREAHQNKFFDLIFASKNALYFENQIQSANNKLFIPDLYQGIKRIYYLDHYIIGLSISGHLFQICLQTRLIFNTFVDNINYLIEDLIIMENNNDVIELLILTKVDENGSRFMKLVDFPSFSCNYELKLPQHVWLVSQSRNSVNVYYLSGENSNELNIPQEVELKLIFETQAEQRLKKLIQKGHLDDAEKFGKQFELSLQPIYEAKARRLLMDIQMIGEKDDDAVNKKFKELISVLKLIENKDFFVAIRSMEVPSRTIASQFLEEMLNHLKDDKYQDEVLQIKEQQLRLETLSIVDPCECNLEWQKFIHHPNITKVCTSLFKTDILTACLIWKRHASSIIPHLDQANVVKILHSLPPTSELFEVIQWLRNFIPSVLQIFPKSMPLLVEWSLQKIRSLQFSNLWPEIGLEFSTNVANIFEDVTFLYSDIERQHESSMQRLRQLVQAIQDLYVLKKRYNLVLTLDNYLKDSIDDTALRILQRVQISKLQNLVNDFLYPIYMEKGRSPNKAIIKYIHFLVANRKGISFWLDRSVVAIELLHNEEEKLQYALLILKSAPVPWPEVLNPLLKLRNSSHPLATEISTECELQNIKIIRVKYGWPADSTDNNLKLVFTIVKMDFTEMLQDIKDVVQAAPEINLSANFYCCHELVRRGRIEKAIEFLDSVEERQRTECLEKLFNIFMNMLELNEQDSESTENMIEFLRYISPRLSKYDEAQFYMLININNLRNKFNIKVDMLKLKNKYYKIALLQEGCNFIAANLDQNYENIVNDIWRNISELTNALNLEKIMGIIELAKVVKNIYLTGALAYYILEFTEATKTNCLKYMDLAALLIFQQIEAYIEGRGDDPDSLVYPLAFKLLIKALQVGKMYQLEIIELLKWVQIGNNLYKLTALADYYENTTVVKSNVMIYLKGNTKDSEYSQKRRESISIFEEVSDSKETAKQPQNNPVPVLKCVSYCLMIIALEVSPQKSGLQLIASFMEECIKENYDLKKLFYESLEHLIKCKQYSGWYVILQYLLTYQQRNAKIAIVHESFVSSQVTKLFQYLLNQKEPNFIELFAILISDPSPKSILEFLFTKLKSGQQKINLLMLSEMYNTHIGNMERITIDRENRMKYYYYTELCKQDSSLKNKSDIEFVAINQIMKELRSKVLDVTLLEKLSRDFHWNYQEVLVSQLISVLQLQEPVFEIRTDALGKEELVMKVTANQILELCQPYINEVTNTDLLATKLLHFVKEINFYFYELYICVVDILSYVSALPKEIKLWKNILLFLKHKMTTKRRHRAGQMETDWWLKSQLEIGVLPKIAKYRFPFIPIVQEPLENILDDEVSVDNCVSWFPLVELRMTLQGVTSHSEIVKKQEYFCMSAVKNSIYEYKQQNEDFDTDTWHLQPINNAFLQSILRLVGHMVDLPRILFILYFVTNQAPEGADQVDAAYECYKFAIKYEKELLLNEKAKYIVFKIKRKYPIFKTQHLLHVYNLMEDKLLQLVENPKELIHALYHHELVLKPNKRDINKMASEVATLHNLDFDMLQKTLLQKWLAFTQSTATPDLEETYFEDLNTTIPVEDVNDEFVLRAHYILTSWDAEKAMGFLVSHIFPIDGAISTSQQLQMFECFSKLISKCNLSYADIVNQKQYIITKCVHHLKQLGYNFTIEKFTNYDKLSILKKVWQNHANNSQALEIISYICLGFDIYIPQIWNGVLKQMVHLYMVKELNTLVDVLSCKHIILNTEGLAKAWECVLRAPFKSANRTRSSEQETVLHKNLFRMQSCPLIGKLNLVEIAEDCIRLDRPHMATILIAFCSAKHRNEIQKLVEKYKGNDLQKDVLELQEIGILPTITNTALKYLNL